MARLFATRVLFGALLLVGRASAAQSVAEPGPARGCDSTALRTPVAMVVDTLRLVVRAGRGRSALPPTADILLEEIASRLHLPRPITVPVYGEVRPRRTTPTPGGGPAAPALRDAALLTLRRDGGVRDIALLTRSYADGVDAALLAALHAADSSGAIRSVPRLGEGALLLSLTTARADSGDVARDVLALSLPLISLDATAWPKAGNDGPRYPVQERQANLDGDVDVEFVIDERGAVSAASLWIGRYTAVAFARAAVDAIPKMRFTPATVGGCPVKQLVRQPFSFRITR